MSTRRGQLKRKVTPLPVVPQVEEIQTGNLTIYDIAEYFSSRLHFVFLDSRLHGADNPLGRFSFAAVDPFMMLTAKGKDIQLQSVGNGEESEKATLTEIRGNVLDVLDRELSRYTMEAAAGPGNIPFLGGGIGYFSYELARQIEDLPSSTRDVMGIPECYIAFYNAVVIYDHLEEKMFISFFDPQCACTIRSLQQFKEEICAIPPGLYASRGISPGWISLPEGNGTSRVPAAPGVPAFPGVSGTSTVSAASSAPGASGASGVSPVMETRLQPFKGDFTPGEYMEAIKRIKEYIIAGEVYQVDMTQRFEVSMDGISSWELYKRLLHLNPAPYAAYLNFAGVQVMSSSPERFLKVNGKKVATRPIKGTVKRGADPVEDEKNRNFLFNDEKNRAELAMIVDLLRNDLGRVCSPGTVQMGTFPELETYTSVFHLACTISGELAAGKGVVDLLEAAFPGGSISGAPKIRAMEIIDELERVERGVFTGSIGYLGYNGNADLNIVIRTITAAGGKAHIQSGGGVVADSRPGDEYDETLLKAQKLFAAFLKENS